MVEPVHSLERGVLDVVDALPRPAPANDLGLVRPDDGLSEGVVLGVPAGPDRGDGARLGQALGVADRQVLAPSVGVMHEAVEVPAVPDRHLQGVEGQIGPEGPGGLPAHDEPAVRVDDEGHVDEARPRRHVTEVVHPQLLGPGRGEVPVDEIGGLEERSPPGSSSCGSCRARRL
jgi:hypothetical protein